MLRGQKDIARHKFLYAGDEGAVLDKIQMRIRAKQAITVSDVVTACRNMAFTTCAFVCVSAFLPCLSAFLKTPSFIDAFLKEAGVQILLRCMSAYRQNHEIAFHCLTTLVRLLQLRPAVKDTIIRCNGINILHRLALERVAWTGATDEQDLPITLLKLLVVCNWVPWGTYVVDL